MHYDYKLPVLIIGAGLGGTALMDIFLLEKNIKILAIVDRNPNAYGISIARSHGIEVIDDVNVAIQKLGRCLVFNMTKEPELDEVLARHVGFGSVVGAEEASFFWNVISRLQSIKCELLEDLTRMQAVIHNVQEAIICITQNGVIEAVNPATEAIFGYRKDELIGQPFELLIAKHYNHGNFVAEYLTRSKEGCSEERRTEITAMKKDKKEFPLEVSISDMSLGEKRNFVVVIRDITERKIADEKLNRLALYDGLTGLPNRANFLDKLEYSLAQARRNNHAVALLFIDLDGFKQVNDFMGHAAGDHLLKEVARRLQNYIRESDIAARMGGDEFTIMLNNLQEPEEATLVAEKLITALNQPVQYFDKIISQIGASIGISIFPDHSQTLDSLIKAADEAMYRAKAAGKNRFVMC
jgi:diguanylate cyclase (GGDEF)-like protein/PAS domain S-box-containing protein